MKITQILSRFSLYRGGKKSRTSLSQPASADWSDLPVDILQVIYEKLKDMGVCIRFGAVCRQWRAIHSRCQNNIPPQPPMFLALPSNSGFVDDTCDDDNRFFGSNYEWLIKISGNRVQLLNPFMLENNVIQLPDLPNENDDIIRVLQVVLSHNPTWTSDYVVVLIYHAIVYYPASIDYDRASDYDAASVFAFHKSGEKDWNTEYDVDIEEDMACGIFYNDRFYAMCLEGLMCWDVTGVVEDDMMPTNVALVPNIRQHEGDYSSVFHLVESRGELLCIVREDKLKSTIRSKMFSYLLELKGYMIFDSTIGIQIFRFEDKDRTWTELTSLGGQTIFLGTQSSTSLDASNFPEYKPNHIYFHSQYDPDAHDVNVVGVFNTKDSSFNITDRKQTGFPIWVHAPLLNRNDPKIIYRDERSSETIVQKKISTKKPSRTRAILKYRRIRSILKYRRIRLALVMALLTYAFALAHLFLHKLNYL